MKLNKLFAFALTGAALASCVGMDDVIPQGGTLLDSQVKETTSIVPQRADATYVGMYYNMSCPLTISFSSSRPDNFGFAACDFSSDVESGDIVLADSGYNWFSVCGDLESRNADYANPYIRYATPYNTIANANSYIANFDEAAMIAADEKEILAKIAQAKAVRAYSYLYLAPYFQFNQTDADLELPCVPLVNSETTDFTNNPRASVKAIYDQILSDLTWAIQYLEGYQRPDKSKIDQQVAYGLRARAYLNLRMYKEAQDDAEKAAEGYTPASIKEVSVPSFMSLDEHNWIWGYGVTTDVAAIFEYATSSSWIRSFSANGYAPACQVYSCINNILYDKISTSDVRKGWWVDENLESPLLNGLAWPGFNDVANADDGGDSKTVYLPYTNVKFGCYKVGTITNDEDWPMMRVEEMLLIKAECQAKLGDTRGAQATLTDFVSTYRDPDYIAAQSQRNILDEIWFQRRIELWGEGFTNNDMRRLAKPMVRFVSADNSNVPGAFRFNMEPRDGWWLMRFPTSETNTNLALKNKDNIDGNSPVQDQNPDLRDGVTDPNI